jgi:hypothetical protein
MEVRNQLDAPIGGRSHIFHWVDTLRSQPRHYGKTKFTEPVGNRTTVV